jgi:hypothetical protein
MKKIAIVFVIGIALVAFSFVATINYSTGTFYNTETLSISEGDINTAIYDDIPPFHGCQDHSFDGQTDTVYGQGFGGTLNEACINAIELCETNLMYEIADVIQEAKQECAGVEPGDVCAPEEETVGEIGDCAFLQGGSLPGGGYYCWADAPPVDIYVPCVPTGVPPGHT